MATFHSRLVSGTSLSLLMSVGLVVAPVHAQDTADVTVLEEIVLTAEEQAKQALGASTITAEELEKTPVANDISEIVRKMPGVNLTGNSASGQYGNNRQIDIRGMGPENTLILIDGKPVLARNSAKMGRAGERDTRGDSNWVAPELIERIEVLRGPAAARYGSGSSGGVVNIITKRPDTFIGSVGMHYNSPEGSAEGDTTRSNFMLAGPAGERLTYRLNGNYSKHDGDAPTRNAAASGEEFPPAGVEGVINKDLGALLTWDAAAGHEIDLEAAFSRQGNVYVGERGTSEEAQQLAHDRVETSRVYRRTLGVTHRGDYDFGTSSSYLQWENTRNASICKGTAGSSEGRPQFCVDSNGDGTDDAYAFDTVTLDNITGKTEWALPLTLGGRDQTLTLGAEIRHERMSDPSTPVLDTGSDQASKTDQTNIGIYAEDNIQWNDRLTLTPALRLDWADTFGVNVSPSLNATYDFNDSWSMKVGVARAFKAPNLFQLNPNYAYTSMGNGCRQDIPDAETRPPFTSGSNQCYIYGNPDLDPETSINGEIGIAYEGADQVNGSLTFFHNDYKDRISAGDTLIGYDPIDGRRVFVWDNTSKAVIQGLEGNFSTPLGDRFAFNANATYMIKSEDKETGQPLSLVPKHTINASLDWYATEALTVTVSATNYGRITPRTVNTSTGSPYAPEDIVERAGYTLFNLGSSFKINDTARLSAGITNLFDKEIYRTGGGSDANTFNEPGRAFYLSLSATF